MRLLCGRTIISRENVCLVQMSVLYKTHLDATIHWCNPPAHFWRTNYCALVKQTIWKANPPNCTCQGIQAPLPSRVHAAFVWLLLVLTHICLLSGLKAHQRRVRRLCSAQGNCFLRLHPRFLSVKQLSICFPADGNGCMAGECTEIAWLVHRQLSILGKVS